MYPDNDNEFEDIIINKIRKHKTGWSIDLSIGTSFFVENSAPIEPYEGMTARFYGKGPGSYVRGLFLNGKKVFYHGGGSSTDPQHRSGFKNGKTEK